MSTAVLHCFLFFLAVGGFHAVTAADPVKVNIYYESLCPDSKLFFWNQFNKTYWLEGIQENIKPVFIPFGKGNKTDNSYSCQHGPVECQGNKLQACAISNINNATILAKYIVCIMNNTLSTTPSVNEFPGDLCKDIAGDSYNNISACYNATGWSALDSAYNQTMNFFGDQKYSVPYISINNTKPDDVVSQNATTDFKATLCNQLKSLKLKACPPSSSASTIYATLIPAVMLLILSKLL